MRKDYRIQLRRVERKIHVTVVLDVVVALANATVEQETAAMCRFHHITRAGNLLCGADKRNASHGGSPVLCGKVR